MAATKPKKSALVECPRCEATVDAAVVGEYEHFDQDFDDEPEKVQLVRCPRCGAPLVVGYQFLFGGTDDPWDGPFRIFPPREKGLSPQVPRRIRAAYEEAHRCFRSRSYTAAAIMCRKALEGITKEQGATAHVLAQALRQLRDSGAIDERLFQWSEALRVTGNDAAHGVDVAISREDAEDALHFTEAIADYLFVFKDRFDKFKSRLDGKKASFVTKKLGSAQKVGPVKKAAVVKRPPVGKKEG